MRRVRARWTDTDSDTERSRGTSGEMCHEAGRDEHKISGMQRTLQTRGGRGTEMDEGDGGREARQTDGETEAGMKDWMAKYRGGCRERRKEKRDRRQCRHKRMWTQRETHRCRAGTGMG